MRRDFTPLPGIERRNRNPKLHARQAAPEDCLLYVKGESLAAERPSATPSRPHGRTGRLPRGARFHPILPREARETALAACPLRGPATARSGLAGLPRGYGIGIPAVFGLAPQMEELATDRGIPHAQGATCHAVERVREPPRGS